MPKRTARHAAFTRTVNTRASSRATSSKVLHTDDPEKIIRNDRKASKARQNQTAEATTKSIRRPDHDERVLRTIEITSQEHILDSHETDDSGGEASLYGFDDRIDYFDQNPRDTYYREVGYLPPLSEETIELLNILIPDEMTTEKLGRLYAGSSLFKEGLADRNVIFERDFKDPLQLDLSVSECGTSLEEIFQDVLWEKDLVKTSEDPQEFVFQRTMMMLIIDRSRLLYKHDSILDFTVERIWSCPPMPSSAALELHPKLLSRPKADLSIAFRTKAFFPDMTLIPVALRQVICYEGTGGYHKTRAFHFIAIEAKRTSIDELESAFGQVLNAASQSLHNMYSFFREADSGEELTTSLDGKHLKAFFEKVRFFSVACTRDIMMIRVHRACPINDQSPTIDSGATAFLPDYPLQFVHDTWKKLEGSEFTRQGAVAELDKIMNGYGAKVLFGCLKEAADAVREKCIQYPHAHDGKLPRDSKDYNYMNPSLYASRASTRQSSISLMSTASGINYDKKRKR